MCEPMTVMAGLSMGSALVGADQQSKLAAAQETARRKNIREAVRQANYADAAIQIQDKENFKDAQGQMNAVSVDRIRANGTVKTAIGESNLEGRTMERVVRDVDNTYLQAGVDIQRNYDTAYTNSWAERDAIRNNLISTIEGSAPVAQPSKLGQALNVVGAGVSGAIAGSQLEGAFKGVSTTDDAVKKARGKSSVR